MRQAYYTMVATIYGLSYPGIIGQVLRDEVEAYSRFNYQCSGEEVVHHRMEMGRFFSKLL